MFGLTRSNPATDLFSFERDVDRLFNQFWNDLPARTAEAKSPYQVHTSDEGWRIDVPLPGIDPRNVHIDVAGHTLAIRAEEPATNDGPSLRYQHAVTLPQFLDVEKISAAHRHGMLQLTLPLKASVKPRRIPIDEVTDTKRIASAA